LSTSRCTSVGGAARVKEASGVHMTGGGVEGGVREGVDKAPHGVLRPGGGGPDIAQVPPLSLIHI
ncbi:hypothetical protein, partial [Corynebacterium sp. NML 120412]|uniref:hypothetical protein n=1 Tax=Corynebacterium sp. NML 120412 TaxID=2029401 RepID=UPI001E356423